MPFTIVRQDITKMKVDAIVNAANTDLVMGGGVCGAIFYAAGAKELQEACDQVAPIQTGGAAITPGFQLPAKYVIHAVGPVYCMQSPEKSEALLRSAYTESLKLAAAHNCKSISFPLISSGIYGYPKAEALQVASAAIRDFLSEHDTMSASEPTCSHDWRTANFDHDSQNHDMDVFLAVFDNSAFAASKTLMGDVQNYIDEHYVDTHSFVRSRLLDVEMDALAEAAPDTRCRTPANST